MVQKFPDVAMEHRQDQGWLVHLRISISGTLKD
jgi:hypothetical protein